MQRSKTHLKVQKQFAETGVVFAEGIDERRG